MAVMVGNVSRETFPTITRLRLHAAGFREAKAMVFDASE
jgi:hypothetical protein